MADEFDNIVTNEDIGNIADAIREVIMVPDDMTIVEMPEKIRLAKLANVTWQALKDLRDSKALVPGREYRITDYVTTAVQENTRSAGHQFDIIVTADDVDKLNEQARAIQHAEDTYFANSKLEAWKLMYCLDNDTTRFAWADEENGKGVIYRMIDEWNNDCPYDFKNIQYKRYAVTAVDKPEQEHFILGNDGNHLDIYYGLKDEDGNVVPSGATIDENNYVWAYTFSDKQTLSDGGFSDIEEGSIRSPYGFGNVGYNTAGFVNNSMRQWIRNTDDDLELEGVQWLNNISMYGNVDGEYRDSCFGNEFGANFANNSFGNYVNNNSFGNSVFSNSFGNDVNNNTFGNNVQSNSFGNNVQSNSFGNNVQSNSFGNNVQSNSFGNSVFSNSFGNCFMYNTVKNYVQYVSTPDTAYPDYFQYVTLENGLAGASAANRLNLEGIQAVVGYNAPIKVTRGTGTEIVAVWQNGKALAGLRKATPTTVDWS